MGRNRQSYYIPASHRANLSKYRYSGVDKSFLSRYVLSPYWNNLVKLFPISMAPNAITLLGLTFVAVNVITMIVYLPALSCTPKPTLKTLGGSWDPLFPPSSEHKLFPNSIQFWKAVIGQITDSTVQCPGSWIYFSWALGLWFYQSLDAIDGKQARRTGTSGPLGEMFDHGCDALNTTLEVLLCASALNLGQSWWTVISEIGTIANFYLTTWEEYHTGTLFLSAFSGPVEGIIIIIVLYLITGFKGPGFWDQGFLTLFGLEHQAMVQQYNIKNIPLNECFMIFSAIGLAFNIFASSRNVIKKHQGQGLEGIRALLQLLPFVFQAGCNVLWLYNAPSIMGKGHLVAFLLFWGVSFAYQVGLLITAHTTKQSFPYWNMMILFSMMGAFDAWQAKHGRLAFQTSEDHNVTAIYVGLAAAIAVYSFFVYDVVGEICDYFDINCLTIKHKAATKQL